MCVCVSSTQHVSCIPTQDIQQHKRYTYLSLTTLLVCVCVRVCVCARKHLSQNTQLKKDDCRWSVPQSIHHCLSWQSGYQVVARSWKSAELVCSLKWVRLKRANFINLSVEEEEKKSKNMHKINIAWFWRYVCLRSQYQKSFFQNSQI